MFVHALEGTLISILLAWCLPEQSVQCLNRVVLYHCLEFKGYLGSLFGSFRIGYSVCYLSHQKLALKHGCAAAAAEATTNASPQ